MGVTRATMSHGVRRTTSRLESLRTTASSTAKPAAEATVIAAATARRTSAACKRCGLLRLDPADQVVPADRLQQGRVVGRHVPADHAYHLVVVVAAGDEPALTSDQFHPHASCSGWPGQRNARILA